MSVEFGFSDELVNTQYAALAAMFVYYQQNQVLQPLEQVEIESKVREFRATHKLSQLLFSILAGCNTLSEVNPKLKQETALAKACGWSRFADQSNLSRLLDGLTLKQLKQLRTATTQIWRSQSWTLKHDWRAYLWLDYDLSGLPCGVASRSQSERIFQR